MLQVQLLLLPLLFPPPAPPPPLLPDEHPMPDARKHDAIATPKPRSVEPRRDAKPVLRSR
jgi:hypothetical protein